MLQIILGAVSLGLLWAVMTIGVYITYRILDIADLTVEGSIAMGAAIAAQAITGGINPYIAVGLALLGGMAAGLVTGLLHTQLKIPALLSGILTMIALYSINLRIMGKANVSLLKMNTVYTVFENLGLSRNNAVIALGLICVLAVISILYWFFGTEIGCAIRATGNNPHMVRAQGINTDITKILGLVISNGLVALSGALIAQSQSFADVQMGTGSIVIGLASVIIGEVLFGKRNFYSRLVSLALGAITYRIIIAFVLKMGMPANDLKLFTAITVAVALALPTIKNYIHPARITIKEGE
ncbi:ABC transporter permease [Clostridium thermosuccinogenes]|jgi:putative ABC transport system permease protein|uniref:ABC transporter permease n=1 Tax=Clostridium thermosuccinogenes TaxID=84032 RepID=A0A2K2FNQ2_9CLOT|nr:ABC transporter permease [Pseudoclostridium thermosuccinogenes]AUS95867.1 ABC transporter permease [Pseudoclostridium thermosuccinogenes]PNT93416.1 ABC transporter permease [Pseudoclostridium thermosuccinogenes]PNT98308.1 ABC transporter permease [Pseudoclostridium thermosuccinogenes]PNU00409.1 ABC transporter permease [Pseudoclostridium thermosuccinogenes]